MLTKVTSSAAPHPPAATHPASAAPAPAPRPQSLPGDTTSLHGSRRAPASLVGHSDEAAKNQAKRYEDLHRTHADGYKAVADESNRDKQRQSLRSLAEKIDDAAHGDGVTAGKKEEAKALAWKIPLTLFSGALLGLVPAWYIASKDDKTIKQYKDQLAAAQTN